MPLVRVCGVIGLVVAFGAVDGRAQPARPVASVTPVAEREAVPAGRHARFAVQVALPEGLHVQSNKPRDESLIPTVLTVDVPAGVTVRTTVYPRATDLTQAGQAIPLAVYGHEFAIGVELKVDGKVPLGELKIPARLRYQACDDRTCFPPTTARLEWTVWVIPASQPAPPPRHQDLFKIFRAYLERSFTHLLASNRLT